MNYHIIPQDKFFEAYIEDIYRINQETNNIIWIRGEKGDSPYFQTNRPVEYLGKKKAVYLSHFQLFKPGDKLFVARYDSFIGNILLQSKITIPLYVYLMGVEFYAQPEWYHEEWLLDPITKRRIMEERLYSVYLPLMKPWKWFRWFVFKKELHKKYLEKLETVKRIDFIVLPEHATEEIKLIYHLYPGCKAKHRIGTFDQNFDLSKSFPLKQIPSSKEPINIFLGNSSDPNGNQMDAIHYLKKKVLFPYEVYCPLSYGDREVGEWIRLYGEKELGPKFHPITEFMERKSFICYLNKMDIVIMYHNRQQAVGTIMTALALGKPVFMKQNTPLFMQLKSMGIKSVYDVEELTRVDLIHIIHVAQEVRMDTLCRIDKEYSESTRLANLSNLLGECK